MSWSVCVPLIQSLCRRFFCVKKSDGTMFVGVCAYIMCVINFMSVSLCVCLCSNNLVFSLANACSTDSMPRPRVFFRFWIELCGWCIVDIDRFVHFSYVIATVFAQFGVYLNKFVHWCTFKGEGMYLKKLRSCELMEKESVRRRTFTFERSRGAQPLDSSVTIQGCPFSETSSLGGVSQCCWQSPKRRRTKWVFSCVSLADGACLLKLCFLFD